jgi:hypothetical protein
LKKEIKRKIAKSYLCQFVKKDFHNGKSREEPCQSIQALSEINVILDSTSTGGNSNTEKRKCGNKSLQLLVFRTCDTSPSSSL